MHHLLNVATTLLLTLIPVDSAYLPTPEGEAISTVINFRHYIMGDSLPFDTCSVYEALGRPTNFPEGLDDQARGLLSDMRCAEDAATPDRQDRYHVVTVDSIRIIEGSPRIHLSVSRGHYIYREEFVLKRRPDGVVVVIDVHIRDLLIVTRPGLE